MMRLLRQGVAAAACLMAGSCLSSNPLNDLPPVLPIVAGDAETNPFFVSLPPDKYGQLFETVLETLYDYGFEFAPGETNRYSGQNAIETLPRTSPGLLLVFKAGSPDLYFRLLSTTQSYRHRVTVNIQTAELGGFFVEFVVRRELEDVPRPIASSVGGAVFRSEATSDRQSVVIDATFFQSKWIFKGRDTPFEQELIRRFKKKL